MVFKYKHHADIDFSTNHPNQYFEESQKIINGVMDGKVTFKKPVTPMLLHTNAFINDIYSLNICFLSL